MAWSVRRCLLFIFGNDTRNRYQDKDFFFEANVISMALETGAPIRIENMDSDQRSQSTPSEFRVAIAALLGWLG